MINEDFKSGADVALINFDTWMTLLLITVSQKLCFEMAALRTVLAILTLAARAHTQISLRADDVILNLEPQLSGGFLLILEENEKRIEFGHIGRTLLSPFTMENIEGGIEVHIENAILQLLTLSDTVKNAKGIRIRWDTQMHPRLEDCISFGSKHWYGGPMQLNQVYPIEDAEYRYTGYVVKEANNGVIAERYWLNSAGEYIYVHPQVPLFVDYRNLLANHICFGAQKSLPYSSRRNHTELTYDIWFLSNVKEAHKHAVANYLGKPSDLVDYKMVKHPIWSTWAQYSEDIDATKTLEFANEILDHGFNNSQIEIDDMWESCYGSLTVDENKFPDLGKLVSDLKNLGYRVTIWIHPLINKGCDPWYSEALENGYLMANEEDSFDGYWWNSNGTDSGYIDFTNPDAAEWWYQRVKNLSDTYGIDSFKIDAGETDYIPSVTVQHGDIDYHPHHIVEAFVRTCARFGNMIEVRCGFRTQDLPIFVRMVDRDSIWGLNNGLSTLITTSIQMNLNGYTYVLPDMIGGNGYNLAHEESDLPTKELFIRWVQANTFLPAMQFSFVPWQFDSETTEISRRYADLHAEYADYIYEAMKASVENGSPVVAPLWWADPNDNQTFVIWDEFLLGERILVAPVLTANTTSRAVYLPSGVWFDQGDTNKTYEGPTWITYSAPLDVLPYFVRDGNAPNMTGAPYVAVSLVLFCTVVSVFMKF